MQIITRKEAKTKGAKRYFTGKPCKHGHTVERKVSCGNCLDCAKVSQKAYAVNNQDKVKAMNNTWRKANTERVAKVDKARLSQWRNENRGHANKFAADRRAAEAQATMTWEQEGIKELYDFAQLMKKTFKEDFHVDHIIPLKHRKVCGLHTKNNLRVITSKENLKKSNKWED